MPAFHLTEATTVSAGVTINTVASGGHGYLADHYPAPDFTNLGNITFTLDPASPVVIGLQLVQGMGLSWHGHTVTNAGQFTVTSTGAGGGYFLFGDSVPNVINSGTITVSAANSAYGISTSDPEANFSNSGQLLVTGSGVQSFALSFGNGGTVNNSGLILAQGAKVGVATRAIFGSSQGVDVINDGEIRAVDADPNVRSVAIYEFGAAHIVNRGLISGETAIADSGSNGADFSIVRIENSGTINGDIQLGTGHDVLLNTGTITGNMDFGSGNDTYDGRLGMETGLVSGGDGQDTELGGVYFDNLQGNIGDDSLSGGAGDDFVVGGKDNDAQTGDAGGDVVWGNLGNDTVDGGDGADQVRGGQGDDSVVGGAGDDFVSGDRGNDTITGGAGADRFHGSQDAGIDRVMDFRIGEGDRVQLDPGTTYTVSQAGADTVIDMGAGYQMILVGVQMSALTTGWIFLG